MKTGAIALLALPLFVLGACRPTSPPPPPPAEAAASLAAIVATLASAVGDVQIRRGGQAGWEPGGVGAVLRVGDEVKTGTLSTARIEFLAGGGLELEAAAAVVIDVAPPAPAAAGAGRSEVAAETRVEVKEGVVRGILPTSAEGTPSRGLLIRGSDGSEVRLASKPGEKAATFRLSRKAVGTEIAVLQGSAGVRGAKGEATLAAGQVALASVGALGEATELIDFPQSREPGIDARFQFTRGLAIRLAWDAVPEASAYRVQVATDLSFQHVEAVRDVGDAEMEFTPSAPGLHVWRVASRDAGGRLGEYGFARRLHCEVASPRDLLVGPADGTSVKTSDATAQVAFSWETAGEARGYRLVVARGPDLLEEKVTGLVVQGQRAGVDLAPGDYWWGVFVDADDEPKPLFMRPRRLSVKKVAKPKVEVPKAITDWGR